MHPTLVDTQHLIASKLAYLRVHPSTLLEIFRFNKTADNSSSLFASVTPVHGDVVAFEYPVDPSLDLVKRVIGFQGTPLKLRPAMSSEMARSHQSRMLSTATAGTLTK